MIFLVGMQSTVPQIQSGSVLNAFMSDICVTPWDMSFLLWKVPEFSCHLDSFYVNFVMKVCI